MTDAHPFFCDTHNAAFDSLTNLSRHYDTDEHDVCQPCAMREEYRRLKPTTQICLKGNFWGCKVSGQEMNEAAASEKTGQTGRRINRVGQKANQASAAPSDMRRINPCPSRAGGSSPRKANANALRVSVTVDTESQPSDDAKPGVDSAGEPAIEISLAKLAISAVDASANEISLAPAAKDLSNAQVSAAEQDTAVLDVAEDGNGEEEQLAYTPSGTEVLSDEESSEGESSDGEECMPNEGWELIDEEDELALHGTFPANYR